MRPHIRYICIVAQQPTKLADFYVANLGLRELGRSAEGDISLTDGFYNLTLRPQRGDARSGLSHFGVAVDNVAAIRHRLERHGYSPQMDAEPGDVHHGQARVYDLDGLPVSLSVNAFGVPPLTEQTEPHSPRIRHATLAVESAAKSLEFYERVFDIRGTSTNHTYIAAGKNVRLAGDGETALALLMLNRQRAEADQDPNYRDGFNHFGFVVDDLADVLDRIEPDVAGRRSSERPFAEHRTHDPEGNAFDLSQDLGYEVSVGMWVRGRRPPTA